MADALAEALAPIGLRIDPVDGDTGLLSISRDGDGVRKLLATYAVGDEVVGLVLLDQWHWTQFCDLADHPAPDLDAIDELAALLEGFIAGRHEIVTARRLLRGPRTILRIRSADGRVFVLGRERRGILGGRWVESSTGR